MQPLRRLVSRCSVDGKLGEIRDGRTFCLIRRGHLSLVSLSQLRGAVQSHILSYKTRDNPRLTAQVVTTAGVTV